MDLCSVIRQHLSAPALAWLEETLAIRLSPLEEENFLLRFTNVTKYLAKAFIPWTTDELRSLSATYEGVNFQNWSVDELVRAKLLVMLKTSPPDQYQRLVEKCYLDGDNREQCAVLKALPLLVDGARFIPIALEAFRSNVLPIFASLACDNPFAATHFSESAFNNLILKGMFVGLPLSRIQGLAGRRNPQLARMANAWIDEREAADRPVPWDIWKLLVPFAEGKNLERIYRYLQHGNPQYRYGVAISLKESWQASHLEQLQRQYSSETDPRIKETIEQAIAHRSNGISHRP